MPAFTTISVNSSMNPIILVADVAFVCTGSSPCIFRLPTTSLTGFRSQIIGVANLWQLRQIANQTIHIGIYKTITGINGRLTATSASDSIEIVCINTIGDFKANIINGNISVT